MSYVMPCHHVAITLQVVSLCVSGLNVISFVITVQFVCKTCRPIKDLQLQLMNERMNT